MFQVLIGILVIAALVIIGVYVYQKRTLNAVDALLNQKAAALTTHLDERFAKNANPELSGDSLKDFNQLKDEYQDEFLTAASRVDDLADQIAQDLHGFNLLKVKPDLRKLQDATAKLLSEQTNLEEGLKKIDDAKAEHQKAIGELKKQYQQFHNELEENSYRYGKSSTALRQRLTDLEARFAKFTTLTAKGDYEAAQDVLNELQQDTEELARLMQKIPDIYFQIAGIVLYCCYIISILPDWVNRSGRGSQHRLFSPFLQAAAEKTQWCSFPLRILCS